MKASELIEKLQGLMFIYGNLDVHMTDWSEWYSEPTDVVSVYFSEKGESGGFIIDAY